MDVRDWVTILVPIVALVFTALSFKRTSRVDTSADAAERATMTADIRYIRTAIEDIKVQTRVIQSDVRNLEIRLSVVEASCKQAHKRLDEIKHEMGGDHDGSDV